MSQRKFSFAPGSFYHVYNRGVERRAIFLDEQDYRRFQLLLYIVNGSQSVNVRDILRGVTDPYTLERGDALVSIGAYCLMPNHFHLLLTPRQEDGLSLFMQKLSTAYSMYFNKRYRRAGALFEGKFKAQLADEDQYLKYLFSYIHLNPIKLIQPKWKEQGITDLKLATDHLDGYLYSSYLEFTGKRRPETLVLDRAPFPDYFENVESAMNEIKDWLSTKLHLGKT